MAAPRDFSIVTTPQQRVQPSTQPNALNTQVLFVTGDTAASDSVHHILDNTLDIPALFSEVHILRLQSGGEVAKPVSRVADNVWLYTIAGSWWQLLAASKRLAATQLQFAGAFRPDLIVARDTGAAAIVASELGRQYGRPTQLHTSARSEPASALGRQVSRVTVPRFKSVRTATTAERNALARTHGIKDAAVLPRFHAYEPIATDTDAAPLQAIYQPLRRFMLYVGELSHESSLFTVLHAVKDMLRHQPQLGLVVLGDGDARRELSTLTKTLGIDAQVIFVPEVTDVAPYLRAAELLFATETDAASEALVLQAAVAGTPLILTRTSERDDIFTHQDSAFFCRPDSIADIATGAALLLGHESVRTHFSDAAKRRLNESFYTDPAAYKQAYQASILTALSRNVSHATGIQ